MPSFDELLAMGNPSKRQSIEGVSLNQDIQEAQAIEEHQQEVRKVRMHEKQINKQVEANIAKRKEDRAKWGTDDPKKIAAVQASGLLAPDLMQNMQIDPEGTRARAEMGLAILGKGGVQDIPDGPLDPSTNRTFYRENPETGTLEFTNIAQHAPSDQGWRRYNSDSGTHKDLGAPGGEAGRVSAGDGSEGAVAPQSTEDLLFGGKLAEAQAVLEKPERDEKRAQASEKYLEELWGKHDDIHSIRQQMQDDWFSGAAKARGLRVTDLKHLDAIVLKRGKRFTEMTAPGIDKEYFKPWVKLEKKNEAGIAEPASVVNPEGGTSETTKVAQKKMLSENEAGAALDSTLPKELPTAFQYSQGTAVPKPQQTPITTGRPTVQPGSHLRTLADTNIENPIDTLVNTFTPAPSLDPEEALRKRQRDVGGAFRF